MMCIFEIEFVKRVEKAHIICVAAEKSCHT